MRKIVVAIGIVLVVIALATPAIVVAEERHMFERPTYAVGDTWEYKNGKGEISTRKVIEVSETGFVAITKNNRRLEYDRDGNRVDTGARRLAFPLHVGKKWQYDSQSSQGFATTIDIHVKKLTTITTKAGTFEALLIESCWTRKDNSRGDCGQKFWYAPKVKRIVKRESPRNWTFALDNDFELVSYTLAGQ